jgi:hypothetical protein
MRHEARQVPSWLIFDVRQSMNEPGNPKSSAFFAGAFVCAMSAPVCVIAIDDSTIGGIAFVLLFLVSLALVSVGIVIGWRERGKRYGFVEPTRPLPTFLLRTFRCVAGFTLAASGAFMIYFSFAMYARGESFPFMGLLMGASIGGFGMKGLIAGLKKPNKAPEPTPGAVTSRAD